MNVFLVHGAYGSPLGNWFQWLKKELTGEGIGFLAPKFPTPKNQNLESWLNVFQEYQNRINKKTIFVGHSIGCAFILNVIEQLKNPVKASFFVSGFIGSLENPTFDSINSTIADTQFNWEQIKQNCSAFYLYHSRDDPYVPLSKAQELQTLLGASLHIEDSAGHFNSASGYAQFPQILKDIKSVYAAL